MDVSQTTCVRAPPGAEMSHSHRHRRRRRRHAAIVPGSSPSVLRSDPNAHPTQLAVVGYGPDGLEEAEIRTPEEVRPYLERWPVTWLRVHGLRDVAAFEQVAEVFGLHRLVAEDMVNVPQRPKHEHYGERSFIVTRMAVADGGTEQVSLVLGPGFLISVQETPADWTAPILTRLREGRRTIRSSGADYLLYALIDAIVDGFFPLLEVEGDRLEDLEQQILAGGGPELVGRIQGSRRLLIAYRRVSWPQREAVAALERSDSALLTHETRTHLRDCHDHAVQVLERIETLRELAGGLMDLYLSVVSHRMNDVMKHLTLVATIFIPLSFIAGLYGMNFDRKASPWNMPELGWRWGYPVALLVMGMTVVGMLYLFRRRGLIGDGPLAGLAPTDAPHDEPGPDRGAS